MVNPLDTNLRNLVVRAATEFKSIRSVIGAIASLSTDDKSSIVAAINEVNAKTASAGAAIDDTTARTTTVYSSNKTEAVATAAAHTVVDAVVNGAPTAFDTLKEIADYIASDQSNATAFQTALDNRISVAGIQTYTAGQITNGLANLVALGAAKKVDLDALTAAVGPTDTDYVALFNASLA